MPRTPPVATPPRSSAVATALGLGPALSLEEVVALEQRYRNEHRFCGQGCGEATDADGVSRSAYWNLYKVHVPSGLEAILEFGHIQHGEHPLFSLNGPDFRYRRQGDVFVLQPPPDDAH